MLHTALTLSLSPILRCTQWKITPLFPKSRPVTVAQGSKMPGSRDQWAGGYTLQLLAANKIKSYICNTLILSEIINKEKKESSIN